MLPQAFFYFVGAEYDPLRGPFCVHAGAVASPVAELDLFEVGPASPNLSDPDAPDDFEVLVIGQVYCPGIEQADDLVAAVSVEPGAVAAVTSAAGIDETTDGESAAQESCKDD